MIRIGILGAGHFARAHLRALGELRDRARVLKVARRALEVACPEAEALGATLVSVESLIAASDIDAVIVCTPNHVHHEHAVAALNAGKHVFCEKPMALTLEHADAMVHAANITGRVLLIGHLTRHIPVYATVADLLAGGRLGAVRAAYASRLQVGGGERLWRMDPAMGGGVGFDLLIHDMDLLSWYVGRPLSVYARGRRHPQGAFEHLAAVYTYPGGVVAIVEGGFLLRPGAGRRVQLRIICARGHLEVDTTNQDRPIRLFEEGQPEECFAQPAGMPALPVWVPMENLLVRGLVSELSEFLDTIEGHPRHRLCLPGARQAVEMALFTNQSAETGKEVTFAWLEDKMK